MKKIFLNNHILKQPSPATLDAMKPYFTQFWESPHSPHSSAAEILSSLKPHYASLYELLGASENDHFVFTSSGAEAISHLHFAIYSDITAEIGKNHFITSKTAEAPAIMAIDHLENLGCKGTMAEVNSEGIVTVDAIIDAISPRTALISLPWANTLTGVINPIEEIAAICRKRSILLHIDVTHMLSSREIDLKELSADFLTFEGSALHAPSGCGGLLIREGQELSPLIFGGEEQDHRRGGSFSTAFLAAMATAAKETVEQRDLVSTEIARLRDKLEEGIIDAIPRATIFFQESERLPTTSAIAFPGVTNESMLFALSQCGLLASIGGNSLQKISMTLTSSRIPGTVADRAISFSLSRNTTEEDIDEAIAIITKSAKQLEKMSETLLKEKIRS